MQKIEETELTKLIAKYLSGECNPKEEELLISWYENLNDNEQEFFNNNLHDIELSKLTSLKNITDKLKFKEKSPAKQKVIQWHSKTTFRWSVAASLLLFISSILIIYTSKSARNNSYQIIYAATGKIKKIKLVDGTQVWLNAKSSLSISQNYNDDTREVKLNGEAYFDVEHMPSKPFIVKTNYLNTEVLGTAFSVSAYDNIKHHEITVKRGKVRVSNDKNVLAELTYKKKISYDTNTKTINLSNSDDLDELLWINGILVFNDEPLQDIAIQLQNKFGYRFIFKNNDVKNIRLTATFENDIKLIDLMEVLKSATQVKYKINNEQKTILFL
jgi:transmembrane sensor